jgi:uncharacterized membrane protein YkoI
MKYNHERLMEAKKTVALVNACTVPVDQAIATAVSRIGGTVFEAKLKEVDLRVVWRVKLLVAGQRIKVYIDGQTGRLLEAKAEIAIDEQSGKYAPILSNGIHGSKLEVPTS